MYEDCCIEGSKGEGLSELSTKMLRALLVEETSCLWGDALRRLSFGKHKAMKVFKGVAQRQCKKDIRGCEIYRQ